MNLSSCIGRSNGHFKNKENRAQKLIDNWQQIHDKMVSIIMRGHGISEKARCAYATLVMMETGIRVGNESSAEGYICNQKHHPEYGKTIQVYGLTTLRKDHVNVIGNRVCFEFLGKKAVAQSLNTTHPVVLKYASAVSASSPNHTFFGIDYTTLYRFIKKSIGNGFKPKDIRTAKVNLNFINNINRTINITKDVTKKSDAKKYVSSVVEKTAEQIGHTKGVCKNSYISKRLLSKILDSIIKTAERNKEKAKKRKR